MSAQWTSRREASLVHDDFRPSPGVAWGWRARTPEMGFFLPAVLRVVANPDFDGPRDEVVLEEAIARGRIQADLQPTESVLRAGRPVVLAPDRLLVRLGAPRGPAILELECDVRHLKPKIGDRPIEPNDALRRRLARTHDHVPRRDVRHELAVLHVLRVDDAVVRLPGAAFQLADEPRAVRRADLDLGVLREEGCELLPLPRDRVEVHGTRGRGR